MSECNHCRYATCSTKHVCELCLADALALEKSKNEKLEKANKEWSKDFAEANAGETFALHERDRLYVELEALKSKTAKMREAMQSALVFIGETDCTANDCDGCVIDMKMAKKRLTEALAESGEPDKSAGRAGR